VGQKIKRTVQNKVFVPLAAAAVSAGASYLARKLPLILEERVLPKLRESGAPEIANKVESVASALPGTGSSGSSDGADEAGGESSGAEQADESSGPDGSGLSNDEREAERQKREQRRQERKRALSSA
jgi:hypothetical protein